MATPLSYRRLEAHPPVSPSALVSACLRWQVASFFTSSSNLMVGGHYPAQAYHVVLDGGAIFGLRESGCVASTQPVRVAISAV